MYAFTYKLEATDLQKLPHLWVGLQHVREHVGTVHHTLHERVVHELGEHLRIVPHLLQERGSLCKREVRN